MKLVSPFLGAVPVRVEWQTTVACEEPPIVSGMICLIVGRLQSHGGEGGIGE